MINCTIQGDNYANTRARTYYVITMDFRPRETLFFCDNFLTLELIGFNFRHEPFQVKRQFLSIWLVNEKSKFGVLVVGP